MIFALRSKSSSHLFTTDDRIRYLASFVNEFIMTPCIIDRKETAVLNGSQVAIALAKSF